MTEKEGEAKGLDAEGAGQRKAGRHGLEFCLDLWEQLSWSSCKRDPQALPGLGRSPSEEATSILLFKQLC